MQRPVQHGSVRPMTAAAPAGQPVFDHAVRSVTLNQLSENTPWRIALNHDRTEDLLIWITRGQGVVTIDGIRRGIGAHNALYLPAGTLMSIEVTGQVLAQAIVARSGTTRGFPETPCHLRIRDGLAQGELTAEMEAIQREQAQNRPLVDDALAARLELIGVWIKRQVLAGASDAPPETAARRLVHRFAHLVVHEFRQSLTMADFAERLDVTPTHLARVCRECSGKTASDILTERRLHAAQLDLITKRAPVKAVAEALGFQSAAYFTRFMQQHTGLTPTAYRQKNITKDSDT